MIIYLNGPINAGKTTIARSLRQAIPDLVHIEVDDLRHFATFIPIDDIIPLILEDAVILTQAWARRGYDVVVTWPISTGQFDRFEQLANDLKTPLYGFTLLPDMSTCLRDRGDRHLSDDERRRIPELYKTLFAEQSIGSIIDTGIQTPTQTKNHILQVINHNSQG